MSRWLPVLCLAALLLGAGAASSTTVIQPTFDELVSKAETIFVAETVDRRSEWETTRQGRSIITLVTFDVARVLKGHVGLRTQLTFLGGTVGDVTLGVAGMPEFRVGDRDVLFVSPQQFAVSPLIGFAHGRFRITRDPITGADEVRTHDGRPLVSVVDLGGPLIPTLQTLRPMALSQFESLVRQKVVEKQRL